MLNIKYSTKASPVAMDHKVSVFTTNTRPLSCINKSGLNSNHKIVTVCFFNKNISDTYIIINKNVLSVLLNKNCFPHIKNIFFLI